MVCINIYRECCQPGFNSYGDGGRFSTNPVGQMIQNASLTTTLTYITAQISGTTGGVGSYTVSTSQSITSST